jgi:peptidyl-prolyl cis-trans isomerase C
MPRTHLTLSLTVLAMLCLAAPAQQQDPPPPGPVDPPPAADVVAATVNGKAISELAVYRGQLGVPSTRRNEVRAEVLNFLIDNALIDQYLEQMKVAVDAKDVDGQLEKVKTAIKAQKKDFEEFCKLLFITETDLRLQIQLAMRWEKFITQYATDKTLQEFFDSNKPLFDGSQMRAKHILVPAAGNDAQAVAQAQAKIALFKKQIEDKVAQALADAGKLDNLELQKKKLKVLEDTFAEVAAKESACPSKTNGGELGWFPRTGGRVVDPFARAAFALKPGEMSDAVATEFGYHLILAVDFKAGMERKFEDIREIVKDRYADKMREAIIARMRPAAKIVLNPAPK